MSAFSRICYDITSLINRGTDKDMNQIVYMTALLVGILPTMAPPIGTDPQLGNLSLTHLEQRLSTIDADLQQLAQYSLRSGIGPVGYRSKTHSTAANTEWIRIDLGQETPIDRIVLVPTIWRDTEKGFIDDGFPLEFSIIAGNHPDPNGTVLAHFGAQDRLLPRIAPLIVPCSGTTASWIRIEATVLSSRAWDGKYILQLDEILVFNGHENMALKQPVRASSSRRPELPARRLQNLVDGFLPYLMDAHLGGQSIAFVSQAGIGDHPSLTIDLETVHTLNRIHLHAVDLSDTVPISTPIGFGVPQRLCVEGAIHSDFSDAVNLIDYYKESVYDTGPIIMRRFPDTPCRYVRLTAIEPYIHNAVLSGSLIGFAEIELFSQGRNVALCKPAHASFDAYYSPDRSLSALTDGCNLYGQILPLRNWMDQLAQRHDLEGERPMVAAELNRRYTRQKTNLTRMKWLAALLGAGVIFTLLLDRILRLREVARIKERFAADLHDELGANLHTIGLLSDLAEQARDEPDELTMLHKRIRTVTERTRTAMHHCTAMQEAKGLYAGLKTDMQRAAQRIMAKLDHDITVEGEEFLEQLKPRTRMDLFLFYKECLVNISRHSGATRFSTHLTANPHEFHLTVSDNGRGIEESKGNDIPSSLKRRARLLGARVSAESPPTGGTRIVLSLRTQRLGYHK
jgi:signal transduction histidine kinase